MLMSGWVDCSERALATDIGRKQAMWDSNGTSRSMTTFSTSQPAIERMAHDGCLGLPIREQAVLGVVLRGILPQSKVP